jgi:hypothetical protein
MGFFLATAHPETEVLAAEPSATAFPETMAVAMVDLAMVEQATADPKAAGEAAVDQAAAAPETAVPHPDTAVQATADQDTTDLVMAVPATPGAQADPETETVDLSEQAFFARALVLSDHPVSFDTGSFEESRWPTLDLEGREQRRAHFTRVVGVIVATLGVGALLAVVRPSATPAQAAPIAASLPVIAAVSEIQAVEPTPTLLPELSVTAPDGSPGSAEPAASSASPPTSGEPAPSAARARKRPPRVAVAAPPLPVATPHVSVATSPVLAPPDKPAPPTARFAD